MSCLDDNTVAALLEGKLSPETRARVEAHVESCEACRTLVAEVAAMMAPAAAPTQAEEPAPTMPEFVLGKGALVAGKLRVERLIGRGGMGAVYAATHEQLGSRVAIKVMLPALAGHPEAVRRFLNEARAAARIGSEHVARVLDVGTVGAGVPFLAMELLEGEDLSRVLQRRGTLPVDEAVDLVLQALCGIAHAHAIGIVHRDLKLANLFVARQPDGTRRVKVLDFGISKIDAAVGLPSEGPTVTGAILGSPHYMAPEQLRDAKSVDARADVWAIGVVLYKLLSGVLPFEAASIPELVLRIASDAPPSLRAKRPELPEALERVVLRCLARDVRARWPDVAELARALAPFATPAGRAYAQRATQVLLGDDAEPVPSKPPSRRGRYALLAGVVALAGATALALVFTSSRFHRAGVASPPTSSGAAASAAPAPTAITDLSPYGTTNEEAARAFREGQAERRQGNPPRGAELLRRAIALDPTFPPAHVELLLSTGATRPGAEERAEYAAAAALRDEMTPRDRMMLDALEPTLLRVPAEWGEAEARLRAAADAFPGDAEVLCMLGWAAAARSFAEGAAWTLRAIAIDPGYAGAYGDLVDFDRYAGLRDEARANADRCLATLPSAMNCLFVEAQLAEEEGRCADLERFARRMLAIDPGLAVSQAFLAKALAAEGTPAAAREILARMPAEEREFISINSPSEALVDFLVGDFGGAEALAKKALAAARAKDEREALAGPSKLLVEIDLERGELPAAAKVASDYLARSEAWEPDPDMDDYSLMADPTPTMLGALRAAGRIRGAELEDRRARWLARWRREQPDVAPYLWAHAYADVALADAAEDDAAAAIAAKAGFAPPLELFPAALPSAGVGVTFAIAGRIEDATPWLARATKTCRAATVPFEQTRALYWLGRTREHAGDDAGACGAYREVLARWGAAKPRSVTAEAARSRSGALACGAR